MSLLGQGAEEVSAACRHFIAALSRPASPLARICCAPKASTKRLNCNAITTRGLETLVTETTKLTEISVKAAGAASAPVVAHYDQTLTRWRQSIVA